MVRSIDELKASMGNGKGKALAKVVQDTDANVTAVSEIIRNIGTTQDTNKSVVATALLNTFNLAIQRIGKRHAWTPRDFMSFGLALAALEQIGPEDRADDAGLDGVAGFVREVEGQG